VSWPLDFARGSTYWKIPSPQGGGISADVIGGEKYEK
jgi:hypothetical protein